MWWRGNKNKLVEWKGLVDTASAFEVPGWLLLWHELVTNKLHMFLSHLNEINKEIAQRYYFSAIFLSYPENSSSLRQEWMKLNIQQQNKIHLHGVISIFQSSTDRNSRDNIHETFSGLLTLYLNSRFVTGRVEITVGHINFIFSTLRSLQCKYCNFCSCSTDVILNATLIKSLWNCWVVVYATFDHNGAGGRAADEPKENSVKRSTKVVLPHKGDIVAFQDIERIWRSCCKWCSWFYKEKQNKYYVNSTDPLTSLEIWPDSPARSCFSRQRKRSLSKDELMYLPTLRINKTKHKNMIETLDMTGKIAISAPWRRTTPQDATEGK